MGWKKEGKRKGGRNSGGGWLRDVTGRAVCEAGRDGGEAALGRRLQVGDVGLLGSSWGRPGTGLASRRGRLC